MKILILGVLALGLAGCSYGIYRKADVDRYCEICRLTGKIQCIAEDANQYLKSVDKKLAELGITDADINRALDKRDEKGNKLK